MTTYICVDEETYYTNTSEEIAAAMRALRDAGIAEAPVFAGEPDGLGDSYRNGSTLSATACKPSAASARDWAKVADAGDYLVRHEDLESDSDKLTQDASGKLTQDVYTSDTGLLPAGTLVRAVRVLAVLETRTLVSITASMDAGKSWATHGAFGPISLTPAEAHANRCGLGDVVIDELRAILAERDLRLVADDVGLVARAR